jgi:hypothetical protein
LNAFATGPFVCAFTSCVNDTYCSFRPAKAFTVSIVVFPSRPDTLPSASETAPDGTATTTTSASDASPPSAPSVVTSCPARSQRRASPPPMLPLPIVVIFTMTPSGECLTNQAP